MGIDINGRTALVTGANRGIGRAIVDAFMQHGAAKVYAAVRDLGTAADLVEEYGTRLQPLHIDLEKPESIYAAAAIASDVEVVVNNAGVLKKATPLSSEAISAFEIELKVNVFGLIHMAQAFAPVLKANAGGAFVQVNSVASLRSFTPFATYSASKAAACSLTQALREQLAEQGTQVVSVHPGPIATDMAVQGGVADIAEPPSLVGEGLVSALLNGDLRLYPDSMAKEVGAAYASFAARIVDPDPGEL